ncbi:hypothetical protein [Wukongibacter sp. M2B1]|uniref:hypothetical protein n=1 Tax=Wukongibacter sp. M2B1 TaxID=3088895 RepID=UPI003D7A1248
MKVRGIKNFKKIEVNFKMLVLYLSLGVLGFNFSTISSLILNNLEGVRNVIITTGFMMLIIASIGVFVSSKEEDLKRLLLIKKSILWCYIVGIICIVIGSVIVLILLNNYLSTLI